MTEKKKGCSECLFLSCTVFEVPCKVCRRNTMNDANSDLFKPQIATPAIKDSGDRTEFTTGAVRDMHTGKGRMDLLPVTAIIELSKHCENGAIKYGERNVDKGIPQHSFIDSGLRHLFKYLRGDKDENHLVAALWNIAWAVEQEVNKPELIDLPNR